MGLFTKKKVVSEVVEFSPVLLEQTPITGKPIDPGFQGKVKNKKVTFPDELGNEHPFNFQVLEKLYSTYGLVTGSVDKYVDFIVGPGFFVTAEEGEKSQQAVQIINDFMRDINFETLLRDWIREALLKGNGFLELGGKKADESPKGVKLLNANWMYVNRDSKGIIKGFNQFVGGFEKFTKKKIKEFKPHQIAHLPLCVVGDGAYGIGIISPALKFIDALIQNQKDLHMLMGRKANAPLQIKLGAVVGDKYYKPSEASITKYGKDLEWLNNKHEWATDGLTEMKVVDFGNIGEKFNEVLNHDLEMIRVTFQIPEVLWGNSVNLATAPVQMDAFERRVKSIQQQIEKVIEKEIFRRVLLANKVDIHVEFNWGKLSTLQRDNRLSKLTELINSNNTSESLRKLAEREIVNLMEFDEKEFEDLSEEEEKRREEERSQPLVPGQNANPPTPVRQSFSSYEHVCGKGCAHTEDSKKNWTLTEWLGFNYDEYVDDIESFLGTYEFGFLAATSAVEIEAGLLSQTQISSLRGVMSKGFKEGMSLDEMAIAIDKKVKPQNLLKMENGKIIQKHGKPVLVRGKEHRAMGIIRTETTKVANEGAKLQFKKGGVTHIRWVSSFGKRTCPTCEGLNGEVFPIDQHPSIPIHGMCRCTLVPVTA